MGLSPGGHVPWFKRFSQIWAGAWVATGVPSRPGCQGARDAGTSAPRRAGPLSARAHLASGLRAGRRAVEEGDWLVQTEAVGPRIRRGLASGRRAHLWPQRPRCERWSRSQMALGEAGRFPGSEFGGLRDFGSFPPLIKEKVLVGHQ